MDYIKHRKSDRLPQQNRFLFPKLINLLITMTNLDNDLIRSEINRLNRRLSVCPVIIIEGDALRMIAENQPNDKFYLWQGSGDSPIQDAIDSINSLNQVLNQNGKEAPKVISPSKIKDLITELYACTNGYNKVAGLARILMYAIAYNPHSECEFGDVIDRINDELGSLNNQLTNLITDFGHQLT
ncbi:hypothetical protein [Synechococcus sp. PCC 7502]|uniref:hypothetical protein n=1 Tax=Synechococcus sp. PCC 7502 TaxID=1173263 RepID=UPI00059DA594|nr:hypothetical protein [Synechococcus sp. PCC 7502]